LTVLDVCEPLFQYICRLNRSARKGGDHDYNTVRSEIKSLLENVRRQAKADPKLVSQFHSEQGKLFLVLLFFVDFMVRNSALKFASEWVNLAEKERQYAGDEKFFDLFEECLADRSDAATERLSVYYTCLGLGFTGWYIGQPEHLRRKMLECAGRLKGLVSANDIRKICPDAYEHVDSSNLVQPPGASLIGICLALVGLIAVVLVINAYSYYRNSSDLSESLKQVIDAKSTP
jgi:type VI protein secretion system component VasF